MHFVEHILTQQRQTPPIPRNSDILCCTRPWLCMRNVLAWNSCQSRRLNSMASHCTSLPLQVNIHIVSFFSFPLNVFAQLCMHNFLIMLLSKCHCPSVLTPFYSFAFDIMSLFPTVHIHIFIFMSKPHCAYTILK